MQQTLTPPPHVLRNPTLEGLAAYIKERNVTKILVLVGAGASVAAGIPDFRSVNTGIYANLEKYNLEDPSSAFSLSLLRERPEVFYSIAQEMNLWPGKFKPTLVHHFIKWLADEGRLLRCCTQNIDGLEKVAGVPSELLVQAHGSFASSSCIDCHAPFDISQNREDAFHGIISHCLSCGGIVKPDVVFFEEHLPEKFFESLHHDAPQAELLIIIGTSLQVHPFASLPLFATVEVPRVVFNRERVGGMMFQFPDDPAESPVSAETPSPSNSLDHLNSKGTESRKGGDDGEAQHRDAEKEESFSSSSSDGYAQYGNYSSHPAICRDVLFRGDCQDNILKLAELLGADKALLKMKGQTVSQ